MRWRMRKRDLWLAAGYLWSLLWSAAAVAAIAVALAAGPTDRTTRRWLSYNLLLVPLSFQPATTSSFLCSRWPQEPETLHSLQKPITYRSIYLLLRMPDKCDYCLVGFIYLGSGHGAPRVLKTSRREVRNNRSKVFINIRYFDQFKTTYFRYYYQHKISKSDKRRFVIVRITVIVMIIFGTKGGSEPLFFSFNYLLKTVVSHNSNNNNNNNKFICPKYYKEIIPI